MKRILSTISHGKLLIFSLAFFGMLGIAVVIHTPTALAAPHPCDGSGTQGGYNRERWCGYFNNQGWDDGSDLRGGTWSTVPSPGGSYTNATAGSPGVPASVNTAPEFIDMILNDLYNGDARAKTSAQFIILSMLGVTPTAGNTLTKTVTPAQVLTWQNRVLSYANTSDTGGGTSSGVNGTISWNEMVHMPCGTLNTYYQIDQNDIATFFNTLSSSPNCGTPSSQEEYIIFRDSSNNILFQMRRICMNPEGQISELGPVQTAASSVTETGTIGNQLYQDKDRDGVYNPSKGDTGIPGVTVAIYQATSSCTLDTTKLVATTTTGADGTYQFNNLPVISPEGPSAHYVVVVTDTNHVLNGYTSIKGAAGVDNNGQNPAGTCLMVSFTDPSNQGGDFGYYSSSSTAPAAALANTGDSMTAIVSGAVLLLSGGTGLLVYRRAVRFNDIISAKHKR